MNAQIFKTEFSRLLIALIVLNQLVVTRLDAYENVLGPIRTLPDFPVYAGRGEAADSRTLAVINLSADNWQSRETLAVDDWLRAVPNFSLFRRTSSTVANPTTQGATLRGIGPSGASRALVMYDGIPFNDAFGGWVGWNRLQLSDLSHVEVVRGGGSAAWGNTALGGVIRLTPVRLEGRALQFTAQAGTQDTHQLSWRVADAGEDWGAAFSGRLFTTGGYIRVRADQRGAVDTAADSRHALGVLSFEKWVGESSLLTVRATMFDESRNNGTSLTANATENQHLHLKFEHMVGGGGFWRIDLYGERGDYSSTFSSVSADRNTEQIVLDQYAVPSSALGFALAREQHITDEAFWAFGIDARWIKGETRETVVFQRGDRFAGGAQRFVGVYGQSQYGIGAGWLVHGAARVDYWQSLDGFLQQPNATRVFFDRRELWLTSLRSGVSRSLARDLTWRAAGYQAFRVPTLNELYRPFQVGADQTLANDSLAPERLTGAETGLDWQPVESVNIRATVFSNRVQDPILNLTLGQTPGGGQVRQRRNIERTRIEGVELDATMVVQAHWQISASYAFTQAQVTQADDAPQLVGKRLAQVARHGASLGLRWQGMEQRLTLDSLFRWNGAQYEDDLNSRRLHGYTTWDAFGGYRLTGVWHLQVGITNILNRTYPDGITGLNLVTEGAPRAAFLALRAQF